MQSPDQLLIVRQKYTAFARAERYNERGLDALVKAGIRIRVLCRELHGETPYEIDQLKSGGGTRTARARRFNKLACTTVAASPNALVQSHDRIPCCDLFRASDGVHREWLRQRSRKRGLRARLADRLSPFHAYMLTMERRLYASRRLRIIVCNSDMVREEIQYWYGVDDARIRVIHNGVDTELFHPSLQLAHRQSVRQRLKIDSDAPVFLFAGSSYERKGLATILAALSAIDKSAQLLVVGKDTRERRYRTLAKQLDIESRVHFLGAQPDVSPYYGAADAFVLPALYDPFPNTALEAMAAGLPVITSTKTGVTDVLRTGDNGLICDALDVEALGLHMKTLMDTEIRQRIGLAARQTAEGLGLEAMVAAYRKLYRDIFGLS